MALIPPDFLKCIVGIQARIPGTTDGEQLGTGIVILADNEQPGGKDNLFLVTNRHLVEGYDSITLVMDGDEESTAPKLRIDLDDDPNKVVRNPGGLDLVAIPLDGDALNREMKDVRPIRESECLSADMMQEIGVAEGDGVFIVALPIGLERLEDHAGPLVKQGCISRIGRYISGRDKFILIDAKITPGNSGSPVFLKPSEFAVPGTKGNSVPYLLGMLEGRFTYEEPATSVITGRTRVVFEEHSGIVSVVSSDDILDTLEHAKQTPTTECIPTD